jgi:flagellar M-ring protein FliF
MSKNQFGTVVNIFTKLSLRQKLLFGVTTAAAVILISISFFLLNEPNFMPLYTNMAQEDASKIIEYLNAQKIPYTIDDNGMTIKVPKEKVYETRLSLAGKGIPGSGVIGYEIFDKSTMGMSEFMQKLNFKRALEGELARTIAQQEGVEGVRVHIVLPQKSVFKDEEKLPTASVVLKLNGNFSASKNNIIAITNLISSSVEGLLASKVTIIDTKGRLLSKEGGDDPFAVTSSKQYEIKQSIESYLANKAQVVLDNILGYGNAMVQVNADINFDQVEKTMEMYDPDTQVAISEQTVKIENNGSNLGDSSAQISENTTVNYEISKTIQRVIEGTGTIKRLSVAAVINDISKEIIKDEKSEIVYEPRTPEQLQKLEQIVRNAVGIDITRNDQFSLTNLPFETKPFEELTFEETSFFNNPNEWTNIILTILAIGASIFVLRGLMNKLKNEKIIIGTVNSNEQDYNTYLPSSKETKAALTSSVSPLKKRPLLEVGDIEDELSDEAISKKIQQEKITNYVSKNPMDAAKLINAWLHEDEG